jgi:hypothetical protein
MEHVNGQVEFFTYGSVQSTKAFEKVHSPSPLVNEHKDARGARKRTSRMQEAFNLLKRSKKKRHSAPKSPCQ